MLLARRILHDACNVLHAAAHSLTDPPDAAESHANLPPTRTTEYCEYREYLEYREYREYRLRRTRCRSAPTSALWTRTGEPNTPCGARRRRHTTRVTIAVRGGGPFLVGARHTAQRQWLRCCMRCTWRGVAGPVPRCSRCAAGPSGDVVRVQRRMSALHHAAWSGSCDALQASRTLPPVLCGGAVYGGAHSRGAAGVNLETLRGSPPVVGSVAACGDARVAGPYRVYSRTPWARRIDRTGWLWWEQRP